ncbi:unnamed protein product [Prorocentrum cordatum]|uniref:Uncharacterized protein n=1 Tax=Prorocentrum cordatum TaxID=2364126 RepID=A0ABN9QGK7_9DINO|nr:unnamed protein product [Polarella glacialis]
MGSQGAILEELVDPVPWFNDRGERVFRRHSVNRKTMMSTRRECMHGILKDGIIKGARAGAVFAVPSTVDRKSWVLWQIGAATLFEALYDALAAHPSNKQVQITLQCGVKHVTLARPSAKVCILKYYRDELNRMVGYGAKTTFIECFAKASEAVKGWQQFLADERKKKKDIGAQEQFEEDTGDGDIEEEEEGAPPQKKARRGKKAEPASTQPRTQAGFKNKQWVWVSENFPSARANPNEFVRAKIVCGKLQDELKMWKDFEAYCMNYARFTDSSMSTNKVVICMQAVLKFFQTQVDTAKYREFLFACLKLTIPTDDGIPWCILESSDCKKLDRLKQNMFDSKVFKRAREAADKELLAAPAAVRAVSSKSRGPNKKTKLPQSRVSDSSCTNVNFMDDVINSLYATVEKVKQSRIEADTINDLIALCAAFGIDGTLATCYLGDGDDGEEKVFDGKYSDVRDAVAAYCAKKHDVEDYSGIEEMQPQPKVQNAEEAEVPAAEGREQEQEKDELLGLEAEAADSELKAHLEDLKSIVKKMPKLRNTLADYIESNPTNFQTEVEMLSSSVAMAKCKARFSGIRGGGDLINCITNDFSSTISAAVEVLTGKDGKQVTAQLKTALCFLKSNRSQVSLKDVSDIGVIDFDECWATMIIRASSVTSSKPPALKTTEEWEQRKRALTSRLSRDTAPKLTLQVIEKLKMTQKEAKTLRKEASVKLLVEAEITSEKETEEQFHKKRGDDVQGFVQDMLRNTETVYGDEHGADDGEKDGDGEDAIEISAQGESAGRPMKTIEDCQYVGAFLNINDASWKAGALGRFLTDNILKAWYTGKDFATDYSSSLSDDGVNNVYIRTGKEGKMMWKQMVWIPQLLKIKKGEGPEEEVVEDQKANEAEEKKNDGEDAAGAAVPTDAAAAAADGAAGDKPTAAGGEQHAAATADKEDEESKQADATKSEAEEKQEKASGGELAASGTEKAPQAKKPRIDFTKELELALDSGIEPAAPQKPKESEIITELIVKGIVMTFVGQVVLEPCDAEAMVPTPTPGVKCLYLGQVTLSGQSFLIKMLPIAAWSNIKGSVVVPSWTIELGGDKDDAVKIMSVVTERVFPRVPAGAAGNTEELSLKLDIHKLVIADKAIESEDAFDDTPASLRRERMPWDRPLKGSAGSGNKDEQAANQSKRGRIAHHLLR